MKKFIFTGFLIVAVLGNLSAAPQRITGKALLLTDKIALNNGKEYPILAPPSAENGWEDTTPFTTPDYVDLYFPFAAPAQISSVKFKTIFDSILAGELQAIVDGQWQTLSKLESTVKDRNKVFNISLAKPILTNHLRLVINDVSNIDHDVLKIVDWNIEGEIPQQPALFDSKDLVLDCAAEDNVFDLPDSAKIQMLLKNSSLQDFKGKVEVKWETYNGFATGVPNNAYDIDLAPGKDQKIELGFAFKQQGCFRATAYLYTQDGKIMLAAKRIMFGLRDKKLFEAGEIAEFMPQPEKVVSLDERYRKNSTLWGADITQSNLGNRIPGEFFFKKISDAGGELVMSYLRYSEFEPLPGVYNFDSFDNLIRNARKYNLGLNMGLWWWDFRGPTQFWLADERKQHEGGKFGTGWEGIYSMFSPKFRQHAARAVELMIKRYQNCPEVWLWHPHPYGAVDHDGHGLKDFHPEALKQWTAYLKNKYQDIAALNKAYNANYADFAAVPVPTSEYEKLRKEGKLQESTRVLNYSRDWLDWLDFYHQNLLDMRNGMMDIVRKNDTKRGIGGVNATGGVGKADETFKSLADHHAFYGDQGLNINHQVRRLVAKRQYGLKLRHEDIAPVTIGRNFDENNIIDRCDWDLFQCTFLGLEHFNYVFAVWDNSPFWDRVYANPRAKSIVKESSKADFVERKVAYLHSFQTDTLEGKYDYQGISIYRWWLMNGFSYAMMEPGNFFEIMSLGGDLYKLKNMKLAIDDSSRVMPEASVNEIVDFVQNGGKLVLLAASGEKTVGQDGDFELLKRLGYGDTSGLKDRELNSANLIFNNDNGVFRKTISIPVNFWCGLTVPKDGKALGYIGEKVGAVSWPHGKGEVVLLAGLPGAIPESLGLDLFEKFQASGKKEYKHVWKVWNNAERELGQITEMLTVDLAEWAGVPPQFKLNSDFSACLKAKGDTRLVYMYNQGPDQVPVLRIDLPEGKYHLVSETPTETVDLGAHKSEDISAPGIRLPKLDSKRFVMVRLTPVK